MTDAGALSKLMQIADRIAIEEVLARYCRGIDRCDPNELSQVFTKDAQIDYGDGPKLPSDTIAGLITGLGAMRLTHHNIGNVICEIDGERAACETYCIALHILPRGEEVGDGVTIPDIEMVVGGRYLDKFIKQPAFGNAGEWKIAERLYIMDWNRQSPATMETSGGLYDTLSRRGSRHPNDPSYSWWGTNRLN